MLGTRIIMLGMEHPPGSDEPQNNAEVICAANHTIPIFWLMLFGSSDLELFDTQGVGQDSLASTQIQQYPVLLARKATALPLLQKRSAELASVIKAEDAELLAKWVSYIQKIDFPVFALDTYELWNNMENQSQLLPDLQNLLNSLDKIEKSPTDIWEHLKTAGNWQEGNGISLAGFGW